MMLKKQHGSLLINLGITLAIILLLVTLSAPHLSVMRRFLLRAEIEKIYALFHYLQQRALTTHQDQTLVFDIPNSYCVNNQQEKLSNGIRFGFLPGVAGPPSKPSKQISSPITFKNNRAVFYADGTIAAGTVYLIDHEHKQLYALTSPISQISYLRTYHYQKNSWIPLQ